MASTIETVDDVCIHYTSTSSEGESESNSENREIESGKVYGTLSFFKEREDKYCLAWVPKKKNNDKRKKMMKKKKEGEDGEEEEEEKEKEREPATSIIDDSKKTCILGYSGSDSSESDQMQGIKEFMFVEHGFTVCFKGISTIRKEVGPGEGAEDDKITVSMKDGTTLPTLFFRKGCVESLWDEFERVFFIEETDEGVYKFHKKGDRSVIRISRKVDSFLIIGNSDDDDGKSNGDNSNNNGGSGAWGSYLSNVAYYFNPLNMFWNGSKQLSEQSAATASSSSSSSSQTTVPRHKSKYAKDCSYVEVNEAFVKECLREFEAPTKKGYDVFEILGPEVPLCGKPTALTKAFFASLFDSDGRMTPEGAVKLREALFYGGGDRALFPEADAEVRREAWKYMLGYYARDSTPGERAAHDERRRAAYAELKAQWKGVSPERMAYCKNFSLNLERINKDVPRTDPHHPFFDEATYEVLSDVLGTYAWFGLDNDYVQGMSDCCALVLEVMGGDEAVAFWCFKEVMDRILQNFRADEVGINMQLSTVLRILGCVDPELYEFMGSADAGDVFPEQSVRDVYILACYPLVLILLKRAFPFEAVKRLWEMFFSGVAGPRFHLFVVVAIVMAFRGIILERKVNGSKFMEIMVVAEKKEMCPLEKVISTALRAYTKFCNTCTDQKLVDFIVGTRDSIPYVFKVKN